MIINRNMLKYDNFQKARYYWQFFNGIAIEVVNGVVVSKRKFSQGEEGEDYVLPFPLYETSKLEIDASFLEGDDEPYSYQGHLYNGIAYSFFDGEYSIVRQYEDGLVASEAKYLNANLIRLEHSEPERTSIPLMQSYAWSEDGKLQHFSAHVNDIFQVALVISSGNKLSLINVHGDYFPQNYIRNNLLLLDPLDNIASVMKIRADKCLSILGNNMSDSIFADLLENDGLKDTWQLELCGTVITNSSLSKLVAINGIKQLQIDSEILTLKDVTEFKLARPDCYVQFNQEVVNI